MRKNSQIVENNVTAGSSVLSLERGLMLLKLFSTENSEWSVKQISQALDIPLSSTYRIVKIMEETSFIERSSSRSVYRLGLSCLGLGALVQSSLDVRRIALPIMRRLASEVGDTVVLMVPTKKDIVCVERVEGTYPIRPVSIMVGEHRAYNAGAIAFAILAFLPLEEREEIISRGMPSITESTLSDPVHINERCEQILQTGISYSKHEVIAGTAAIAAPIFDAQDSVCGAISITGIIERIVDLDDAILEASFECSRQMGWRGEP